MTISAKFNQFALFAKSGPVVYAHIWACMAFFLKGILLSPHHAFNLKSVSVSRSC